MVFRMPGGALIPRLTDEPIGPGLQIGELPISAFIGILVGGFLVLLLLLDCLCYCTNNCGLTMCICVHLCGKESAEAKEETEAVEYGNVLPLTDLATQPVYGQVNPNPSIASSYGVPPSYRGYMYPSSEPTYANPEPYLFDNTDPDYRKEKMALERDLKSIFS